MDNKHQSDCCQTEVKVVGGDEGTNHWECLKCGKACNDTFYAQTEKEKQTFIGEPEATPEKCKTCENFGIDMCLRHCGKNHPAFNNQTVPQDTSVEDTKPEKVSEGEKNEIWKKGFQDGIESVKRNADEAIEKATDLIGMIETIMNPKPHN